MTDTVFNAWFPSSLRGYPVFNVMGYGAVGDGVADDTAEIQAAVDAAIDAGGGTVYFPTGTYKVTAAITFLHGVPYTGTHLVRFLGEKDTTGYGGSRILGNVAGFLVDQNDITSYTITTTSGTFAVGDTVTGATSGAPGTNPLTSAAPTLLKCHGGGQTLINGETITGSPSGATGTVVSQIVSQQVLDRVEGLNITNSATSADSGALRLEGLVTAAVRDCFLSGFYGISATSNSYNITIEGCTFIGSGNAANSIGIACLQAHITGCTLVGWDHAIRQSGPGTAIIACRFEVNNVAIRTGLDSSGTNNTSSGLLIAANQTERCNTDVYFTNVASSALIGNTFTGLVAVNGTSERNYGIRCSGTTACLIAGNTVSGNLDTACFHVSGANVIQTTFMANNGSNTGAGAIWVLPTGAGTSGNEMTVIDCNNAATPYAMAFADLPSAPVEGMERDINNSNTAVWGATAAGGGANHVKVRYNGTNWTVVGK